MKQQFVLPPTLREQDIAFVKQTLAQKRSSLIIGMPGVGKSRFLRQVLAVIGSDENYLAVYINLNELFSLENPQEVFALLQRRLRGVIEQKALVTQEDMVTHLSYESLRRLLAEVLKNYNLSVVFILDRFEKIIRYLPVSVLDSFPALFQSFDHNVQFIFSTSDELPRLQNLQAIDQLYTYVHAYTHYLQPYTLADTRALLTYIHQTEISEELATYIYELSGGHSRLIRALDHLVTVDKDNNLESLAALSTVQLQCERIMCIIDENEKPILVKKSPRLQRFGLIKEVNGTMQFFSTLFAAYAQQTTEQQSPIWLDKQTGAIFIHGLQADDSLTNKEYTLLKYFLEHQGEVITKDKIAEEIWEDVGVSNEAIDQLVYRLRAKLGGETESFIQTVFGRGYSFSIGDQS